MKLRNLCLVFAATAAIACAHPVLAQNVPQKFVVSGKVAEKIHDFSTLNLATAERLAETCEEAVTAHGGGEESIMILDKGGNRVYFDRMDGQGYLNVITAGMKARTALMGLRPSKSYMNAIIRDPDRELEVMEAGFYPVAGALPIVVNKELIGVIGVGGYRPNPPEWSDEICAHTALLKVVGPSVPPLLEDLPPHRGAVRASVPRFADSKPPKSALSPEFVVRGKAAAKLMNGDEISLATAKKIALTCREWAASHGGTMSLAILDNAGLFVHLERMDGELAGDMHTAILKAQTALKSHQPTSFYEAESKNNRDAMMRSVFAYKFFSATGGVPIVVDGQMIGAVGVSGNSDGGDENCAVAGLKAAFGDHATLPVYPAAAAAKSE
jgi:glc operon protein GlcG